MRTEDLARRFGAKLREIEPIIWQRLPVAMSDLLRVIAQAEEPHPGEEVPHPGEVDESRSRSDVGETPGE